MYEGSVKNPSDNATASIYYFINFYYVLQRKIIQYKDIRHKGTGSQRPLNRHFKPKSHNSWHNDVSAYTPSLLQDLTPIFWF